ncbi:MAG: TROVE domain-containing protein [Armatimonadota bacterium]
MTQYLKNVFSARQTPQSEPIPGSGQVPNSAGGFAWQVDDWARLDRFLILGSEGGSYYASERKLTLENADAVVRCLEADGERLVRRVVEISESGRAPKNDPAIFALALACSFGDERARAAAFAAVPRVCRIGTHLFHFAEFVNGMRGWGRGLRRAVAAWYQEKPVGALALQAVKYQQRDRWSHRDLLRLAHPVPADEDRTALYRWVTRGWEPERADRFGREGELALVGGFEAVKAAATAAEVAECIRTYRLPREAVPTQWLTDREVWRALLEEMPMTALIRNLATLTRVGLVTPGSVGTRKVVEQLGDRERLRKARVHPIQVLSALKTYASGKGVRSDQSWAPVPQVVDALDAAFYAAFRNVEPTGKRWLLALDVSGSMECGVIAGCPGLTPRVASAAMALVTAAVEKQYTAVAFASEGTFGCRSGSGLRPLALSSRQRLDDVVKLTQALPFGGTDCALPMLYALERRLEVDCFVVYTDSETWAGSVHPAQALRQYREWMGIPARLIVVGMVSNGFSIADPNDPGMLDVVGFDTATPQLMTDFAR